ncbi:MAG: acyl-CoA dehydrogenase family protein [Gammaproteobacteria bacterium]|uniref:acyl-CoA dehydrogenase family protein n=1 Tax=Bradyrhizobium sp. TaxID=376 RepID=UPI003D145BB9
MAAFRLDPDLESFRHEVRKLAEREFAPRAAAWDEQERFPEDNRRLLAELGYFGLLIPAAYGGAGAPIIQSSIFVEEIARCCFNTATVCQIALHGPARAIAIMGTDAQKQRWLPAAAAGEALFAISISESHAGSAITELRTRATPVAGGYVIEGAKCFTTLAAVATHFLVFVRFGDTQGARGIGAVVIARENPGLAIGKPDPKMGGRGAPESPVFLDRCFVPADDVLIRGSENSSESFRVLMEAFGPERCGNAAICVGIAQGAYDAARTYAAERVQFGRPLMEFQGIQWKIADMATQIHAARMLVYRAASNEKNGFPDAREVAMAKLYANEMVQRVTSEALQIHGHYGYTRTLPLERMYRDGRGYAVGGGTTEILRNTIAAMEFGRSFDQRR